jgi:hypothetical protein
MCYVCRLPCNHKRILTETCFFFSKKEKSNIKIILEIMKLDVRLYRHTKMNNRDKIMRANVS